VIYYYCNNVILTSQSFIVPQDETDEEYNGRIIKEGVTVDEWNKFLLGEHRFKGMLWFDDGKVCYSTTKPNSTQNFTRYILLRFLTDLMSMQFKCRHY
jgi:hypothetical protein